MDGIRWQAGGARERVYRLGGPFTSLAIGYQSVPELPIVSRRPLSVAKEMGILSVFRRKSGSPGKSNETENNEKQDSPHGAHPYGSHVHTNESDLDASDEKDDVAHVIMAEHLWTAAAVAGFFDGEAGLHVVSLRKSKNIYV